MLNVMRDNLRHLKWVLAAVAVAMTVYLIPGFMRDVGKDGVSADWAARVDGTEISAKAFLNKARSQDTYYRGLLGEQYPQLKPQLRLGTQVIQSLITTEIQLSEARKLGFQASEQEIADRIISDPSLQDPQTGKFVGKDRYLEVAGRGYPGGVPALEKAYSEEIITAKWVDLITQAVKVHPDEVEDSWRNRNEKTRIRFLVVPSTDQEASDTLTDQDYQSWYDAHQDDYQRGASRTIRYAVVERKSVIDQIEITDEQVATFYNDNPANFQSDEQRRASHILLPGLPTATEVEKEEGRKRAQALLDRIRGGESLADLAAEFSSDTGSAQRGGDLGFFGRGQMVPSFEEAAFSTPVGQVADLVESQFGIHIIQVTDARAAGLAPLEEVQNDIRRELSLRDAEDRIFNQAEQLRAGADSLENFSSAAETAGLPLEEFRATADDRLFDLAPSPEFREAIFDLPVGGVSQPVRMAKGMAILAVVKESPPGVAPLAEVRETVGTAILNDRLRKASIVAARKALGDNQDLDKAAKSLGIEIQDSGDLIPGPVILAGTGGNTPELQATMFGDEIATGSKGILEVPAGALIYEVTDRTPFDSVAFQAGKADLEAELLLQKRNVYLQTVLTKIMEGYEIKINQELIARHDS